MISFNSEQRFIVTGASSGIGEGVALLLNELGATVIGIGRNQERLAAMQAKAKFPENIFLEQKDLTEDIAGLPVYVRKLREKYGKFQGMAFCAGIAEIKPLQAIQLETMRKIFEINYFSPVFMLKGFCDRRNNTGNRASAVIVSSISAFKSDKGHTAYSGSKAAIAASAKCIAREASGYNVRVNCVSPSDVKTPLTESKIENENSKYPFGCGEATDVANTIVYLLSDKSKWTTSQNYVIDCGYM